MSDASTPVQHDDQPLSDDQLSEIAGGGPGGKPGGDTISINYPCDCGEVFTSYDALTRHKSRTGHP